MPTRPKLATFRIHGREPAYGLVRPDGVVELSARFADRWPTLREAIADGALHDLCEAGAAAPADHALDAVQLLPPIPAPEKIICIGVNYPDRNAEYKDGSELPKYPSLFQRTRGSFVGHGQALQMPPESAQFDYEGEIALVIGKAGRRISEAAALDHVFGLTLCNEGSVRDWMRHGKFNVTQGKNFEASGSIGPWIVPLHRAGNLQELELSTFVNGELRQQDSTGRMMFPFSRLISYISTFTELLPGDIIVTGTPTGSGARFDPPRFLVPGDVVRVSVPGIGTLENRVEKENVPAC